eukprot:gene14687-17364_t
MHIPSILEAYPKFIETRLYNRFFKHHHLQPILDELPSEFECTIAGNSFEHRTIKLIKWGYGPVKVFLWSQMHGDEATGTMALFDLFRFLQNDLFNELTKKLGADCTLYVLPMVNPDGTERFNRRNAQKIDLNRDFKQTLCPEALLLKQLRSQLTPEFGFNLHDQSSLWSVKKTGNPASLSYLAPAFDESLSINKTREKAMLVIADIFKTLTPYLPGQIGLFDDEYEGRAFGDNFQQAGTSTILIEAGGLRDDPEKQLLRKYFFLSILSGLHSIQTKSYTAQGLQNYSCIPKNNKEIFHLLIRNIVVDQLLLSIGINYEETPEKDGCSTLKYYCVQDLGDLSGWGAYQTYEDPGYTLEGTIELYEKANFDLKKGEKIILSFRKGILQSKL